MAYEKGENVALRTGEQEDEYIAPIIVEEGAKGKQYLAAIATTIGSLGIGTVLAWTSPALPYLASNSTILDEPVTPESEAWIGSLMAVGAVLGAIPTGYVADSIGRKWTIIGLSIPFILSWILIIFGRNVWFLYIARLLAGFSSGGISVAAPMYIGEIAEVSIRGALLSYFEVLLCIGIMFVYLIGAVVDYIWLSVIMCIIPVVSLVIFLFMPDTPTYHLMKGDKKAAERVLQFFRGVKYNVAPEIKMLQVLVCVGISFGYVVGAVVDYTWLGIIMGAISVLSPVIFVFMPDTPTYLLKKGDKQAAEIILQYFRGDRYNVAPEMKIIEKELSEAEANAESFRDLLRSRANINALLIALGLMFFQQMSGVNIVIFYTANIFSDAGSTLHPDICAIIIGTVQAVITYVSLLLVDKAGRRVLLLCSAIPSFCCLIVLGTFFYLKENVADVAATIGWIPLTAVNIFIISMALGFGPIPWMMMGELFSSSFKGVGSSITAISNWGLVFFVTKTYVNFVDLVGIAGAFWFYAAVTFLGILFIYFKVPETKGKTFLEIQNMLASR